jgi:transcriptional regulator with XRE-family HTH domain
MVMLQLRNRLNRVLHERGLAEGDVAAIARLDQGHLNRIKNGRVKPTLVTAMRIANALGLSVNQLFYLEGATLERPAAPRPAARADRPSRSGGAALDEAG